MRMKLRHSKMAKKVCMILPLYLFTFSPLSAQTFIQNVQKSKVGEGKVTIHQSKEIDELVNAPAEAAKPKQTTNKQTPAKPAPAKPAQEKPTPEKPTPASPEQRNLRDTVASQQIPDTLMNSHRRSYKTTGYRVQAFAGGNTRRDRQRAEQAGRTLRDLFPGEDVYVHFYSPRWVCRLGNYRTYDEARSKMLEVRKMGYESATVVKGKITVYQ